MTTTYIPERELMERYKTATLAYMYNNKVRSLMMDHGNYVKVKFCTDEDIFTLRDTARKLGMKDAYKYNPSSWASIYHDAFSMPRSMRYTTSLYLPHNVHGAWNECRVTGNVDGVNEYDMISAYGWAGLKEVPQYSTAWPTHKYDGAGLYLINILGHGVPIIPPHMRIATAQGNPVWCTDEEIERLDLSFSVVRGLRFARKWCPGDRIKAILDSASTNVAKKIFRAYWGVWLARGGTTCKALRTGSVWTLPNRLYDPVSAHYIISRVRLRVAEYAPVAAHIFTDAIITNASMPQGDQIGDWRIKNNYKKVKFTHAGRFTFETVSGIHGHKGVAV